METHRGPGEPGTGEPACPETALHVLMRVGRLEIILVIIFLISLFRGFEVTVVK